MIKTGQKAPDFKLPDQDGKPHKLSDYKGKKILLYFYPKDFTPGCTKEACEFRDNYEAARKSGIVVLGVSTDTVESHKKFAGRYEIPFSLLADPEKVVVNLYGVWGKKKFIGREYMGTKRTSFLIDEKGEISKVFENVKPISHAKEVLEEAG